MTMAGSIWICHCQCHQSIRGDYLAARQADDWETALIMKADPIVNATVGVDAKNPLEAAVACDYCKGNHVLALTDKPFDPPTGWTMQADGEDE